MDVAKRAGVLRPHRTQTPFLLKETEFVLVLKISSGQDALCYWFLSEMEINGWVVVLYFL